jgi:hypothetical protein
MLYPSVHEGFGLVPFEAAEAGLPCAFAATTSIAELIPSRQALIEMWDASLTADRLLPILGDGAERDRHVAALRASSARYTWRKAAAGLLDVYRASTRMPVSEARRLVTDLIEVEARAKTAGLAEYGPDAVMLVGPNGAIPADVLRPLLAVANRPMVARPLWGALRTTYRAGHRLRRALS